jgi:phosphatidylglycerophosphate synthase
MTPFLKGIYIVIAAYASVFLFGWGFTVALDWIDGLVARWIDDRS